MRYRCLILDHDDTATDGTRELHYPAYLEVMSRMRPHLEPLSLEEWMVRNFEPGIVGYLTGELGMDEDELKQEYEIWRSFSTRSDPTFFDGVLDLLREFRSHGGKVAVVSHSEAEIIERNYRAASSGAFVPDVIYGWELPDERRKPNPWPVRAVLDAFGLDGAEALVIDDLKPGVDMARAAGVPIAGAGWAHSIEPIKQSMIRSCDFYFETVAQLHEHVLPT